MKFKIRKHLLKPAIQTPSPNCDERTNAEDISLLVIHNISLPPGEFGGPEIQDFFQNNLDIAAHTYFQEIAQLRVSSHLLIRRDGQVLQFVPFNLRAWHAGVSNFQGREKCNDFSIGIEMEGTDEIPYTDEQYEALADITRELMHHYPAITPDRITGHSDIAPGRKTDPGPSFDWDRYENLIAFQSS